MSSIEPNQADQVRKIIEKSTSKVSLRDLEKKGFRKVKVLRSNDIDRMIRSAVQTALASGVADREALVARSRQELKEQMSAAKRAEAEINELRRENAQLQNELAQGGAGSDELQRRLQTLDHQLRETDAARLRAEQALTAQGGQAAAQVQAATAQIQQAQHAAQSAQTVARQHEDAARALRNEADELRSQIKQLETEKRLVEQLEVPRLQQRIQELEGELRSRAAAPAGDGGSAEGMRAMFRELLKEVGAAQSGDVAKEIAKLQQTLAAGGGGGRGPSGPVTDKDLTAMKASLDSLFQHEDGSAGVESNIANVSMRESTSQGVESTLSKLKALRKKQT